MATPYPFPANQVLSTLVELLKAQVPDAFIKVLRNCSARIEEDPDTSVIYKRLRTQPPLTKDEAERLKEAFKNDQVAGYGSAEKIKTMIRVHFPDFLKPPEPEPDFPLPEDDDIPF